MADDTVVPDELTETAHAYVRAVGARLRVVRHQIGLSLQAVESTSNLEFKASVLGAYERGERAISVSRLQRLAKLYRVSVDQLLPHENDATRWWVTEPGESPPQQSGRRESKDPEAPRREGKSQPEAGCQGG